MRIKQFVLLVKRDDFVPTFDYATLLTEKGRHRLGNQNHSAGPWAFADGSCWAKVIPLLTKRGLKAIAVQNPLSSLADDVTATHRVIGMQEGPVLLVGHLRRPQHGAYRYRFVATVGYDQSDLETARNSRLRDSCNDRQPVWKLLVRA
ncbi:hypothetical protein [Mesorhizobium sp. M0306]|uniref:hypothetical protein n=1 Tax=Mesorhizobium sp. M0306 TaxID=2956932 RepID=UPI00333A0E71